MFDIAQTSNPLRTFKYIKTDKNNLFAKCCKFGINI